MAKQIRQLKRHMKKISGQILWKLVINLVYDHQHMHVQIKQINNKPWLTTENKKVTFNF